MKKLTAYQMEQTQGGSILGFLLYVLISGILTGTVIALVDEFG